MRYRNRSGCLAVTAAMVAVAIGVPSAWATSPRVAAGEHHTAALDGGGGLWTWGRNDAGQLGYDTASDADPTHDELSTIAQRVGADIDWADVALGSAFTVALKLDGSLYSWGSNQRGELGLGDLDNRAAPARVGTGSDWRAIAAGIQHVLALKTDGSLWAWGLNSHGELGTGWPGGDRDFTAHESPARVGNTSDWIAINAQGYHSLGLRSDGSLWAWGDTSDGQAGITPDLDPNTGPEGEYQLTPLRVGAGDEWVALGSGLYHSFAVKADGSLWSFGSNASGELGIGQAASGPTATPSEVGGAGPWVQIAGGDAFTLGLRADGTLWSWGTNAQGQLGYDTAGALQTVPGQIAVAADWVGVTTGLNHSLAINARGEIWSWGLNSSGELGTGQVLPVPTPTQVSWTTAPGSDTTAPQVFIAPPGGQFDPGVTVRLRAEDDAPALPVLYVTTVGSDPDPGNDSQRYRGPLLISQTTTVKAVAVDAAGNSSAVVSEEFAIAAADDGTGNGGGGGGGGGCFLGALKD